MVFPTRAPGVAVPQDGVEHGSDFVIPEPSVSGLQPRRVVIKITKDGSDVSANADSDVSADDITEDVDPLEVSIPNTPVASPVDTSVIGDDMNDSVSVGTSSSASASVTVNIPVAGNENIASGENMANELKAVYELLMLANAEIGCYKERDQEQSAHIVDLNRRLDSDENERHGIEVKYDAQVQGLCCSIL